MSADNPEKAIEVIASFKWSTANSTGVNNQPTKGVLPANLIASSIIPREIAPPPDISSSAVLSGSSSGSVMSTCPKDNHLAVVPTELLKTFTQLLTTPIKFRTVELPFKLSLLVVEGSHCSSLLGVSELENIEGLERELLKVRLTITEKNQE
ncbi:2885_t:CDS:2, partial [Funneliformis geosporum]